MGVLCQSLGLLHVILTVLRYWYYYTESEAWCQSKYKVNQDGVVSKWQDRSRAWWCTLEPEAGGCWQVQAQSAQHSKIPSQKIPTSK